MVLWKIVVGVCYYYWLIIILLWVCVTNRLVLDLQHEKVAYLLCIFKQYCILFCGAFMIFMHLKRLTNASALLIISCFHWRVFISACELYTFCAVTSQPNELCAMLLLLIVLKLLLFCKSNLNTTQEYYIIKMNFENYHNAK